MSLVAPNLDDRSFQMLVDQATRRIQQSCPAWTDLSVGDPGVVLLETLAFLVETDIYRVNRLPEKAYVEFLRMIGVTMQPPAAARGTLTFTLPKPVEASITVPRGTRVTTARSASSGESPVFSTARDFEIPAGQTKATVDIIHCDTVIAELLGKATGEAGLSFNVARTPIIAETGDDLDLVIGVEAQASELAERAPAIPYGSKMFRIWTEVENFAALGDEVCVFTADRVTGKISFPPSQRVWEKGVLSALEKPVAAVPITGREIRAWYRCGGGPLGNVNPGTITVLKDPLPGKPEITNPEAVTGGRAVESLDHALVRGPRELHALERAVTARDFELLAMRSGGVARAKALTKADRWKYARAGTVEIVIVPSMAQPSLPSQQVSIDLLTQQQTEATRKGVLDLLNERRPLGTDCNVCWTKYKTVRVEAKIEARAEEDITQLKARLMERLSQTISPLPAGEHHGWRFGQSLSVSAIYDACLKEPGVRQVLQPQVIVESVPDSFVRCLAVDPHHAQVWYAANKDGFFRSENDGNGWELFKPFTTGEYGTHIKTHPRIPGLLALCTNMANDAGTIIHVSNDCGESWEKRAEMNGFVINNAAWVTRDGTPILMLATNKGLYELGMQPNAAPVQIQVRAGDQDTGFHSVVSSFDAKGNVQVAVAARNKGGVFLSDKAALTKSFRNIGMAGKDVQVLATQESGTRTFLWAGLAAPAIHDPGEGCLSWELLGAADPPDGWKTYSQGWTGGSCTSLSFVGDTVFAGTYEAGVLKLSGHADNAAWWAPPVNCGLPRGVTKDQLIERIDSLAVQNPSGIILIGGNKGVFRSMDQGTSYASCSSRSFTDAITIPANWLFCSGSHSIEVRSSNDSGKA